MMRLIQFAAAAMCLGGLSVPGVAAAEPQTVCPDGRKAPIGGACPTPAPWNVEGTEFFPEYPFRATVCPPGESNQPAPDGPCVPNPTPQKTATVTGDVDIYDVPGGEGSVIGILRQNESVGLAGDCQPQDWCQVVGKGWVWGHLSF